MINLFYFGCVVWEIDLNILYLEINENNFMILVRNFIKENFDKREKYSWKEK